MSHLNDRTFKNDHHTQGKQLKQHKPLVGWTKIEYTVKESDAKQTQDGEFCIALYSVVSHWWIVHTWLRMTI